MRYSEVVATWDAVIQCLECGVQTTIFILLRV
jgi:hypothetical protein